MDKPTLIIISGPPCTGKTTLAKKMSEEFKIPLVTKDGIKELLFDTLGWSSREWSKKLGVASLNLLQYFLETVLSSGQSLIVESDFDPELETKKFLEKKRKHNFLPIQIMCQANGQVLSKRWKQRSVSGERHPGHVDHLIYDEFKEILLKGRFKPLDIGGEVLEFDTTDLSKLNYRELFDKIRKLIK